MALKKVLKKIVKKTYCKMCPDWEIKKPEKCSNTVTRNGQKIYFCTKKCKERYSKTSKKAA
jgi:uncharacterized pyridoxamine 5'-phosphate oxidase family protein